MASSITYKCLKKIRGFYATHICGGLKVICKFIVGVFCAMAFTPKQTWNF
jgi:hypothetical protein